MLLNCNMDIESRSTWHILTPNNSLQGLPFTVTESGHFYAGGGYYTERNSKKQYYLVYTLSGCGHLRYEGQELLLPKDTAALIYCDHYHFYKTVSDEGWEHMWVHFNGAGAETYSQLINDGALSAVTIKNRMEFERNFELLLSISGVLDITKSVKLSMCVSNLLSVMALDRQGVVRDTRHVPDIRRAAAFIREHYQSPITLDDMTREIHLSKYYFVKLFRQYAGMTPYEYLLNYRIDRAKSLLRNTDSPVSRIAEEVGFFNENNFIRQFKAITGYTPLSYRKTAW